MISIITYSSTRIEADQILELLFDANLIAFGEVSEKTIFYSKKGKNLDKSETVAIKMMTRALFFDEIIALLTKKFKNTLKVFSFPLALADLDSAMVIRQLKELK